MLTLGAQPKSNSDFEGAKKLFRFFPVQINIQIWRGQNNILIFRGFKIKFRFARAKIILQIFWGLKSYFIFFRGQNNIQIFRVAKMRPHTSCQQTVVRKINLCHYLCNCIFASTVNILTSLYTITLWSAGSSSSFPWPPFYRWTSFTQTDWTMSRQLGEKIWLHFFGKFYIFSLGWPLRSITNQSWVWSEV